MAADESKAPKHGRHAAGRHAVQRAPQEAAPASTRQPAAAPAAVPQPVVPVAEPLPTPAAEPLSHVVPIVDGDQETHMGDAPRPIGVDPSETGSFQRIGAADGARVTTRANASETASFRLEKARPIEAVRMSSAGRPQVERHDVSVKPNGRVFIGLAAAALVVLVVVGTLITRALTSVEQVPEKGVEEQTQSANGEGIEYRGTTYAVTQQEGGAWALTALSEDSQTPAVLYELSGEPVTLILYNTVFVIPENLADGTWDLIAYPLGGGSVAQRVNDGAGNPVVGQGQITTATLVGDAVDITCADGSTSSVSLV